jgi:hypothetical protein
MLSVAEEMRKNVPTPELLAMSQNGFILAYDELADVCARLGNRKAEIDELLSVAKSLAELAKKVVRLSRRLSPELFDSEEEAK